MGGFDVMFMSAASDGWACFATFEDHETAEQCAEELRESGFRARIECFA